MDKLKLVFGKTVKELNGLKMKLFNKNKINNDFKNNNNFFNNFN